jgi:hypothetical protein
MKFKPPKGWDRESDTLFIHANGVRIERRVYREREGWFLIPTDLAQEVVYFDPTPEGREAAFAAFAEGLLAKAEKKKAHRAESMAKAKRGRKPEEEPEEESEEDSEEESEEDSEETPNDRGPEQGGGPEKAHRAEPMAKAKKGRKPKKVPAEDSEKDSDEDSEEATDAKGPDESAGKGDEDS